MANKLKITQVRSKIGGNQKQRDSLRSLGLRRIGSSVVRADDRAVRGQITIVAHLVNVEEVDA
ncbi:50S ribosomal protein L30 [Streptomonospora salina]|uniref:Large ribosomal subunit protein uL30 n=1 Tax=Streptomonospora salina TaxID=104205 RepID=A0A841E9Y1_9ACTN|nr:50S ribosomal protein L30 [Streptomonospora salina]MBB5997888.1 large subunit ribosomal protein L30 [Streptomonospora salina]